MTHGVKKLYIIVFLLFYHQSYYHFRKALSSGTTDRRDLFKYHLIPIVLIFKGLMSSFVRLVEDIWRFGN